jgi:NAD+ diphosphatase
MPSSRYQPHILAGPYLNRAAEWRRDEALLLAALTDPQTLIVPVWRTQNLVVANDGLMTARLVSGVDALGEVDPAELILLGEFRGRLCFAVEMPADRPPLLDRLELVSGQSGIGAADMATQFRDLRLIAGELPHDEAGLLAYARAMILWRERHRFCGRCGSRTVAMQAGHVLKCSDAACGNQQFPRIDPAIIVLITDGERALLGRQAEWPAGRYSTIAGFVEPGESLEDAVIREVMEETGVTIDSVDYHSSQPWPFPSSLMLGFTAHAATTDIHLHDAELEDARWLDRAQIAAGEVALPTTHSISFRLIEDWFDSDSARPLREEPNARLWAGRRGLAPEA